MSLRMNTFRLTLLQSAIMCGNLKSVISSVNEDIDCLTQPLVASEHFCVLHLATIYNCLPIVQFILEKKPELLEQADAYNQTPLLWAAAKGYLSILRYLANLGANIEILTNKPDDTCNHGLSPLEWAKKGNHRECVHLLEEAASAQAGMHSYFQAHPDALNLVDEDFKSYLSGVISRADIRTLRALAAQTANFARLSDDEQFQFVTLAIQSNQLKIVLFFLEKNPRLMHISDSKNKTLINWAQEQPDDNIKIQLLRIMIKNGSRDEILSFIQTGLNTLHLMRLHFEIADYLLADERIIQLIRDEPRVQSDSGLLYYYYSPFPDAPTSRRSSFSFEIDTVNKRYSFFNPIKVIGFGNYGLVRKFTNQMGEHRAVKSNLRPFVSTDRIAHWRKKTMGEADIMKAIYPNEVYQLTHFESNNGDVETYNYRFQMPYIKGNNLSNTLLKIECKQKLAELILKLVQEVYRIHQVGYVHGDLQFANILINAQGVVYCIDWGCASKLDQPACMFSGAHKEGYAPERFILASEPPTPKLYSHPSQDIYSLGYILKSIRQVYGPMNLFPSIDIFITTALMDDPLKRPELGEFCARLNSEVNGDELVASSSLSCSASL